MSELLTLARPYAKAAFNYAREHSVLEDWTRALSIGAQIVQHPKVASYLSHPEITQEAQAKVVIDILGDEISQAIKNFIVDLSFHKRLELLPTISNLFNQLKADHEQTISVNIETAFELSNDQQQKLADSLNKYCHKKTSLSYTVDPTLLGGVVIRAGDLVIDGSIRGRLAKLAETIKA